MKLPLLVGACLAALAAPSPASAQSSADTSEPKIQFGALGLTPRIALKDVGVDTNPLNSPGPSDEDFTATLIPAVDSWLRIGRARLSATTSVEWLYFRRFRTQRSVNLNQEARAELMLNRVRPFATGSYLRTRQRPNLEVDARVQQNTTGAGVGSAFLLGTRFEVEAEGRRRTLRFAEGRHGDAAIGRALDRDEEAVGVSARVLLTPLTTFVVHSEHRRDRFLFSSVRDSDSVSVLPGFELKPSALIAGRISVGYRQFRAIDASVPDYGGVVGEIDAHYIWRQTTRFAVQANRDVEYSIEDERPYFVANGATLEVTQVLGLNWYLVGRGGRTHLDYRNFIQALNPTADPTGRTDRIHFYGAGFGRRLGEDLRIGFDVNRVRRESTVLDRRYEGFRYGVSISYGS